MTRKHLVYNLCILAPSEHHIRLGTFAGNTNLWMLLMRVILRHFPTQRPWIQVRNCFICNQDITAGCSSTVVAPNFLLVQPPSPDDPACSLFHPKVACPTSQFPLCLLPCQGHCKSINPFSDITTPVSIPPRPTYTVSFRQAGIPASSRLTNAGPWEKGQGCGCSKMGLLI